MKRAAGIIEIALELAEAGLQWEIQLSTHRSMMPPGRNGPYFDLESPLRNTAHWLVTFSIAFNLSQDQRFMEAGIRLAEFLSGFHSYQIDDVLVHRQKTAGNWCNGVISQAWIAEGLHRAGMYLSHAKAADKARSLVKALTFDKGIGAWQQLDPVVKRSIVDNTYNHQSWFAAIKGEIEGETSNEVRRFLQKSLQGQFRADSDGLIHHRIGRPQRSSLPRRMMSKIYHGFLSRGREQGRSVGMIRFESLQRDVGYQLYVLFSLARLYRVYSDHPFFRSDDLKRALRYASQDSFFTALVGNPFAYQYNAPGFESLLISVMFGDIEPEFSISIWERAFAEQKERTFCEKVNLFSVGTYDASTLAARLYELMLGVEAFIVREPENHIAL